MARADRIAIDGPVASGKSSVGRLVARRLGYRFLDTGLMYRAVTALALRRGVSPDDAEALERLARDTHFHVEERDGDDVVYVDGVDLTPELRTAEVEGHVSRVSEHRGVGDALVAKQREIARRGPIVMVGRDIGTVVLRDAPLKVFLRASVEERARRRFKQRNGEGPELDHVTADIERRDRIDTDREHRPLKQAPDARPLDTDHLTLEQVVDRITEWAEDP